MGGCIVVLGQMCCRNKVSSLYGRVYRTGYTHDRPKQSFLPIWEGVSPKRTADMITRGFLPYMGGCIEIPQLHFVLI